MNGQFNLFMSISKVTKGLGTDGMPDGSRIVSGYASTPTLDSDEEIVSLQAIKNALPDYMEWANIREMHQAKAVGVAQGATVDLQGLFLTAKVVDPGAVLKVDEGVLKGFSIGGKILEKVGNEIRALELIEISLVDRPANPDCRFEVVKGAKVLTDGAAQLLKGALLLTNEAADDLLLKAADRGMLQRLFGWVFKGGDAPGDGTLPHGDVEYADPGYQSDKTKRYPIDTEEHIRAAWSYIHKPNDREPYTDAQLSRIEARIVAAWKAKIDEDGPPADDAKEKAASAAIDATLAELGAVFDVAKNMCVVADMSYAFNTLRGAQRSLLREEAVEQDGKDKDLAEQLAEICRSLAAVIGQKAEHEGGEAVALDDADDLLSAQNYGYGVPYIMAGATLSAADRALLAKRRGGTQADRMAKAKMHIGKAMECHKDAMEACAKAAKMHHDHMHALKAAKAAASEAPEFDHVKCAGHMAACASALNDAHDHAELADEHMGKVGQTEDYPDHTEAGGGGIPGGGAAVTPPDGPNYDPVSEYPGKAAGLPPKKSFTDTEVLALIGKASSDAQVEALTKAIEGLGRQPGPRLPVSVHAVDKGGFVGGTGDAVKGKMEALFKGVDTRAFETNLDARGTEVLTHKQAAKEHGARMLGNMLGRPDMFGHRLGDAEAPMPRAGILVGK